MEEKREPESFMMRVARFIVNKRKAFIALFILACIYSVLSMSKVKVINDLTDYLPESTETRQGLDIMDEQFTTFGSAKIMVTNITYEKALQLAKEMEDINGISAVDFYDASDDDYDDKEVTDYYQDASALYTLTFDEPEDTRLSQTAMEKVRDSLDGYSSYVYTTVDKDDAKSLQEDMKLIGVIVVFIVLGVLLFTSRTYAEIAILPIVFLVSMILSVDYAIIFLHRFLEEREHYVATEATTVALSKAIPEISSSSLTTISGMVALMFMEFGIGMDLGRVMVKAIVLSMVSVFLLMPALLVMMSNAIDNTKHKNFVPKINYWGKFVVHTRFIAIPIFLVIVAGAAVLSNKSSYIYDQNSIDSKIKNEYLASKERIEKTFEVTNTMAVVVPKGDYEKEGKILARLEKMDRVDTALGLANVEVTDDGKYILVDKLNPREFSEVADVDLDLCRVLYQFYALENEQYSAFMKNLEDYRVSIIDMVDFIYEQKEKGGIDFDDDKSEEIDDLHQQICDAREQLEGDKYDRMVFTLKGAVEGAETFAVVDEIRDMVKEYYDESYVVGDATSNEELSNSFQKDNIMISVLTALFVWAILLFTFQNAGLPFLLVLTIQGSIWINFAIPYVINDKMYFLSYLIVSSIQMGATIDYAIVITSRYMAIRKEIADRKAAIIETLNEAFPTIITSGTMMVCAGFVIGALTSNATIASLGKTLGRGALISIVLVMSVLPQLLLVGDKLIDKAELTRSSKRGQEKEEASES